MFWAAAPAALPSAGSAPGRQRDLAALRAEYDYVQTAQIPGVVVSRALPRAERPSLGWLAVVAGAALRTRYDLVASKYRLRRIATAADQGEPISMDTSSTHRLHPGERVGLIASVASTALAVASGTDAAVAQKADAKNRNEVVGELLAEAENATQSLEAAAAQKDVARRFEVGVSESVELRATLEHRALAGIDDMTPEERFYFDNFDSDRTFARTRVAGLNPVALRKVTVDDVRGEHWKPTDDVLLAACQVCAAKSSGDLMHDTLERAVAEGRLFMLEYPWLEDVPDSVSSEGPRYNFIPKALFCVPLEEQLQKEYPLIPVAIWIYRKGMSPSEARLYRPGDGFAWEIAKLIVTVVDGNDHEYFQHLGKTHLLLEPVGIALVRHLHKSHPLFRLLRPHFQGTMFINSQALEILVAVNGPVDGNLLAPIVDAAPILARKMKTLNFNNLMLRSELESRGVLDAEKLDYPYREDALKLWDIIREWVSSVVNTFYVSDASVENDSELQAFADEMVDPSGAAVQGFGDTAFLAGNQGAKVISSRAYLIDVLTMIIFTASCQHAAVNFPQKQFLSYAPSWPLSCRSPTLPVPPRDGGAEPTSVAEWRTWFPPMVHAERQYSVNQLLGSVKFTRLGQGYSRSLSKGRREVKSALRAFKRSLSSLGDEIDARNKEDVLFPYAYLHPDNIPASINI